MAESAVAFSASAREETGMDERIRQGIERYRGSDEATDARLDFFEALWELQDEIAGRLPAWSPPSRDDMRDALVTRQPIFAVDAPSIPQEAFREAVADISSLVVDRAGLGDDIDAFLADADLVSALEGGSLAKAVRDVDAFVASVAGALEAEGRLADAVGFVLTSALTPFLATPARDALLVLGDIDWTLWSSGDCPVCGTPASVGRIVDAGDLEGNARVLSCPLCRAEWGYDRVRCVRCGTRDHTKLHYLFEENDPAHRAHACDACHGYIKITDERQTKGVTVAMIEDVAAVLMDVVAQDRGFTTTGDVGSEA